MCYPHDFQPLFRRHHLPAGSRRGTCVTQRMVCRESTGIPALYLLCTTFVVSCSAHVPMCLNPGARVNALGKLGVRFVKGGHGTDNGEQKTGQGHAHTYFFVVVFLSQVTQLLAAGYCPAYSRRPYLTPRS